MTNRENAKTRRLHPDLESVALLDIDDICTAARLSKSYVLEEIAQGRGPAPLRFGARCTRYRAIDVRDWLAMRIAAAENDAAATEANALRARNAASVSSAHRRNRMRSTGERNTER